MSACACGDNWRVFLAPLSPDSVVRPTISVDFVSLEFERAYLEPGRGSVTIINRADSAGEGTLNSGLFSYHTRPHQAAVFIQRLRGGLATPENPITVFGGFVESAQYGFDGTITLGLVEMTRYLDYRHLGVESDKTADWVYTNDPQTDIAADLVNYIKGLNTVGSTTFLDFAGPRIYGVSNPNAPVNRDRTYLLAEYKNLGEAVSQLTQVINGPVYEVTHEYVGGIWSTYITFSDVLEPVGTPVIRASDVTSFDLTADSNEHANCIQGVGQSDTDDGSGGGATFEAQASDTGTGWPAFDTVQSWDDVTVVQTLQDHVDGYLETHRDLTGSASIVLTGLDYLGLDLLQPGYPIDIDVSSPYLRFMSVDGNTTIDSVSWRVDQTETVTVGVASLTFSESIDTATTDLGCEDC